jgi:GT2 family glycosyltransferase
VSETGGKLPRISVIIVNWNGLRYLETCLRSLLSVDYPKDKLEILLVDNGSTDESTLFAKTRFPTVKILQLDANYGFCRPNNEGARVAVGEYLALLNNDTEVTPGWLKMLVTPVLKDSQVVCCASKMLYHDRRDTINTAGGKLTIIGGGFYRGYGDKDGQLYGESGNTGFGCAAGLLVKKDFFLNSGGFDEDYFAACEEHDLSWKAWLYGYRVVYCPEAIIYHFESGTFGARSNADPQKVYLNTRNRLYNLVKNLECGNVARAIFISLGFNTYRWLSYFFSGKWAAAAAICRGHIDFLRNLSKMLARRREVQSRRRRSDAELYRLDVLATLKESIAEEERLRGRASDSNYNSGVNS